MKKHYRVASRVFLVTCATVLLSCGGQSDTESIATEAELPINLSVDEYIELSLKLYEQGEFARSVKACEIALEIDPNNATAYNNICAAHNRMQAWDLAIGACERGLALEPESDLIKNNLRWAQTEKAKS